MSPRTCPACGGAVERRTVELVTEYCPACNRHFAHAVTDADRPGREPSAVANATYLLDVIEAAQRGELALTAATLDHMQANAQAVLDFLARGP